MIGAWNVLLGKEIEADIKAEFKRHLDRRKQTKTREIQTMFGQMGLV